MEEEGKAKAPRQRGARFADEPDVQHLEPERADGANPEGQGQGGEETADAQPPPPPEEFGDQQQPPPPPGPLDPDDPGGQDKDESNLQLSPEEQQQADAEEDEFRAKYGLDLEEGQGDEFGGEFYEDEEEENIPPPRLPSNDEMTAIIRYLEQEGVGEGACGEGEMPGEDEEEEGLTDIMEEDEEGEENGGGDAKPTVKVCEPNVMVLGPDHPKMARFQAALTKHLKKQLDAADMELRHLDNDLKMKKKERVELGASLYSLQHEILRQAEIMEKYDRDHGKMGEKRERTEIRALELRSVLNEMKEEVRKEEDKELSLRNSVKALDYTEHVVRTAAEKYEGELRIRQLVNEKLEKLRSKAEPEKRDQDLYLATVLTHVQSMELLNAGIKRQIQAHVDEQVQLNTYITEAVTEIEALQIEKMHLQRAWNETVAVVRVRDDAIKAARDILIKLMEELRIRESEMRSVSRLIGKEQEGHERSVILVRRRKMEERVLRRQLAKLEAINEKLQHQLASLNQVRKTVEFEFLRAQNTLTRKEKDASGPRRRLEALAAEKLILEEKILAAISEQSGLSKAAAHVQILIRDARERTRMMDAEVIKIENENALLAVDVETLRAQLFKKTALLSELEKRCTAQERELEEALRDIANSERIIARKTGEVDKLNKQLEKLITKSADGVEMGPLEREIYELEKQLKFDKEEVHNLQVEWLKRQEDLVKLSANRDYLVTSSELLRKEVFVMELKRQRLDTEVGKKNSEISRVRKAAEAVKKEIGTLNAKLYADRSSNEQMDKDNVLIQNEFIALLKDAEMEALALEREIESLEEEREALHHTLRELHEQNLSWEKKVRLAKELKDNLKKEAEGSNAGLRLDIHHMTVRYNDILRTQERLMADLERSIERRDRIITQADINLHRENKNSRHTKLNIQRSFASMKERNKILMKEAREIESQVQSTMEHIHGIENTMSEASNELNKVKETIQSCEDKIAEASILKHKNLVEIVLRQEKFRTLESIKFNRYKPAGRNLEEITRLLEEAEGDCFALVQLADDIEKEYPEAVLHLKLVKASILPATV